MAKNTSPQIQTSSTLNSSSTARQAPDVLVKKEPDFKIPKLVKEVDFEKEFKCKLRNLIQIANQKRQKQVRKNIENILVYAFKHNHVDNKAARELTGLKAARVRVYFNDLEKQGKLIQIGKRGRNVYYRPVKNY